MLGRELARAGYLLWFVCLSFTFVAMASDFYTNARRITEKDGLPQSTIFSLATDQQGFIWLGSPNSLIRYDGIEFREFSKTKSDDLALAVSGAGNIFIDSQQRIWIGSWGEGLALYDQHMNLLHHFNPDDSEEGSLGSNKIQVIFEDSKGDIWIGTNGGGLALYQAREERLIRFTFKPDDPLSISHNRIWSITETEPGILWLATSDGLNRLDSNVADRAKARFQRFYPDENQPESLDHRLIRSVYCDRQGNLWVGTQSGFGLFDPHSYRFKAVKLPSIAGVTVITRIKEDSQGQILIATLHGLYLYDPNFKRLISWAGSDRFQLFPQNDIRDILVDNSGLLWLTTRFAGLIKIDLTPNTIVPYEQYQHGGDKRKINKIYSIVALNDNTMWLSSTDGLLYKTKEQERFHLFELPQPLKGKSITAIARRDDSSLWLGGHFGLYLLDIKTASLQEYTDILVNLTTKSVQQLLFDSQQSLWIGTAHQGLVKYDNQGRVRHYQHNSNQPNSLSGNTIISLLEDDLKQLWVGTNSFGLNRLAVKSETFYHYQHDPKNPLSISSNMINDIYQTRDSGMWFGTRKSLEQLDLLTGRFIHRANLGELNEIDVKAVVEDDAGDIWLSIGEGLAHFPRDDEAFHHFNTRSQIGGVKFLPGVAARNNIGEIYFGGTNGVVKVSPAKIDTNSQPPKTVITNVWVDSQRLPRYDFELNKPLQLSHRNRHLRISFAALDFRQPTQNKYRYQLIGYNNKWHDVGTSTQVSYSNLAPGRYDFQVIGSNADNRWSDSSARLSIELVPPWWQLLWVQVGLVLTVLLLFYAFYIHRKNQLLQKARELELEVNLRTIELDESNQALAQTIERLNKSQDELVEKQKMASLGQMVAGVAHEVNTPLGLGVTASTLLRERINELAALFEQRKLKPIHLKKFIDEGVENTGIIYRNLERAANLINSFKQLAVDQSDENDREFNVSQLMAEIITALTPKLGATNHILTFSCAPDLTAYGKPGPLAQVLMTLVDNSLIHAFEEMEEGLMTIDVELDDGDLVVIYRDNGIGIAPQVQKTVFEPFVTTKRSQGRTGLGLHLVYNMVMQAFGGSIKLTSEVEDGVEFIIRFPQDSHNKLHD